MGKILPGLVVSFVSQKGGSGKTTLTTMFANYLQRVGKMNGLRFVVVDCDNEQNSLYNMRQSDVATFGKSSDASYPVMSVFSQELPNQLGKLKEEYDIILIDFPGNMVQEGVITLYHLIDVAFIPLIPSKIDYNATELFYNKYMTIVEKRKKEFGLDTTYVGVFNRVREQVLEFRSLYEANKQGQLFMKFIDRYVKDSTDTQRYLTTIDGKVNYDLSKTFEELLNVIVLHIQK